MPCPVYVLGICGSFLLTVCRVYPRIFSNMLCRNFVFFLKYIKYICIKGILNMTLQKLLLQIYVIASISRVFLRVFPLYLPLFGRLHWLYIIVIQFDFERNHDYY